MHRFADDKEIRIFEEGDFEDKIQIQIMENIFNFDLMGIANSIRRLPIINAIGENFTKYFKLPKAGS